MALPNGVLDRTKRFEGNIPYMYQDSAGNVTTGVGRLLATAATVLPLPYTHNNDGQPASDAEKQSEWTRINNAEGGHIASFYQQFTTMSLAQSVIDSLATSDLENSQTQLRGQFASYDSFPDTAKAGLIDMAFNLGIDKLINAFPNFCAAVRARDWNTAAAQCHRTGISDTRNDEVRQLFLSAASA